MRIPAATAEPITPATLGPMACISRKLEGFSLWPTFWETRAAIGTAETPAEPIRGLTWPPVSDVHHLAAQNTGCGAEGEGDQAQHDDEQGAGVQEGVGRGGAANGQRQEDGDDVHQLIAGGLLDAIHDAGLLHQVAQHQHTDQNGGIRARSGRR